MSVPIARALVTGVSGQDGSLLAAQLLAAGSEVIGTRRPDATTSAWRLAGLGIADHPRLRVVPFDVVISGLPVPSFDAGLRDVLFAGLRRHAAGASFAQLTEIPLVCDRVLVLHQGRISDRLPASEATEARLLRSAHGLVEAEAAGTTHAAVQPGSVAPGVVE